MPADLTFSSLFKSLNFTDIENLQDLKQNKDFKNFLDLINELETRKFKSQLYTHYMNKAGNFRCTDINPESVYYVGLACAVIFNFVLFFFLPNVFLQEIEENDWTISVFGFLWVLNICATIFTITLTQIVNFYLHLQNNFYYYTFTLLYACNLKIVELFYAKEKFDDFFLIDLLNAYYILKNNLNDPFVTFIIDKINHDIGETHSASFYGELLNNFSPSCSNYNNLNIIKVLNDNFHKYSEQRAMNLSELYPNDLAQVILDFNGDKASQIDYWRRSTLAAKAR